MVKRNPSLTLLSNLISPTPRTTPQHSVFLELTLADRRNVPAALDNSSPNSPTNPTAEPNNVGI